MNLMGSYRSGVGKDFICLWVDYFLLKVQIIFFTQNETLFSRTFYCKLIERQITKLDFEMILEP